MQDVCHTLGISTTSYHRWTNRHGGMKTGEVRRLQGQEKDKERLKQLVAELSLGDKILEEASHRPHRRNPGCHAGAEHHHEPCRTNSSRLMNPP